jgi:hypothetical protein
MLTEALRLACVDLAEAKGKVSDGKLAAEQYMFKARRVVLGLESL